MSRPIMKRTPGFVLASFALAGFALTACASTRPSSAAPAITAVPSPMVDASSHPGLVPTPTQSPDAVEGAQTVPLPAGVTSVTVSFLQPGDPEGTVVYRTTVTSPTGIRTLVDAVDSLHVTGGDTKGCSMNPVNLRLDFAGPGHVSSLVEDSSCRYATLTIDGVGGPQLDSAELAVAEQVVGETAVWSPDGKPSLSPAPPSSAS